MSEQKLTVGELVYKISGDMENLKTELKKADTEIKNIKDSMEKSSKTSAKFSKAFDVAKTAVIGFITGALARGIASLVQSGAELDSLTGSFNRLAGDLNLNANEVLNSLRTLSAGTITDKELILSANRAMVLGVAKNMDEFGQLMQIARLRARDMGITTSQAFDNIVTGIGRGSPLILDNLGIIVKQEDAYNKYAAALGKTSEELTTNEQKEALKFAVLQDGQRQLAKAGELTLSYSERLQQVTAGVTNFKDNLGRALLPTMESLLNQFGLTSAATRDNTKAFQDFSKGVYQVTNFIVGLLKVIKLLVQGLTAIGDVVIGSVVTSLKGTVGAISKIAQGDFKGAMKELSDAGDQGGKDVVEKTKAWGAVLADTWGSIGESAVRAVDAEGFQPVTDAAGDMASGVAGAMGDMAESVSGNAEEAKKKLEDFQTTMLGLIDKAKDVKKSLEDDLSGAFKKFGDDIKGNVQDTVSSLAELVVKAEQSVKEINQKIADERTDLSKKLNEISGTDAAKQIKDATDASNERIAEYQKELAAAQRVIDARQGFEERQAARIEEIKKKLSDAGIDADQAGLDSLLSVQSIEQQIEDQRKLADLDDFSRFEELQSRKLSTLADSLIAQVNLIKGKIDTEAQYEADLTKYLQSEESKRLTNTEAWAKETIAKYGEVAASLQNFLSLQSRISGLSVPAVNPAPVTPAPGAAASSTQSTVNNNRTVNAPVTINANVKDGLDITALSREMGFEVSRL